MNVRYRSFCLLLGLSAVGVSASGAAEWKNEPFISSSLRYDDNVRFVDSQPESSAGIVLDAGLSLRNDDGVVETVIQPRLSFLGYASQSDLNTSDQYLDFKTSMKGLRGNLGLSLGLARDSAITSELEDTGRVTINARRNRIAVGTLWEYRLTPRNAVELGYNFRNVQWADTENQELLDNNSNEVWGAFKRRVNEHDDVNLRVHKSDFESPDNGFDSKTVGGSFGFVRRFSELNRVELEVGAWNADLNAEGGKESRSGLAYSGTLAHTEEVYNYRIGIGQQVAPSSAGRIRRDTRLQGYLDYRFSPRLHWGVDSSLIFARKIGDLSSESDRDYSMIRPFLSWDWTRQMQLSASLRISHQEFKDFGSTADKSEFLVTLTYGKAGIGY
ncbi:MAG TPA: hypothetical protein ENK26_06035 [Gammaproteobacteria bacterium]|nr:hypothetical protein [Gammaproteobacteria bacterium]